VLCLFITPLLPILDNHWSFTSSISLLFLECCIVGIITNYIAICDWFVSLSNMHLSFLHIFSWLDISFILSSENHSIFCMYIIHLSILLLKNIFCGSQALTIMGKAAMNICIASMFFVYPLLKY
jgi:hypothetical protein